ncbi:MAG: AraC family ligand binding domain-containing protein [Abditibacteriaceae bacterium]
MLFNLKDSVVDLHQNGHGADGVKRATLHRNDGAIYVLLAMEADSHMREHQAKAWTSVQCLEGEILFTLEGQEYLLHPGGIVIMEPGQRHSLSAKIQSAALLTLTKIGSEE